MQTRIYVKLMMLVAFIGFGTTNLLAQDEKSKEAKDQKVESKQDDQKESKDEEDEVKLEDLDIAGLKARYDKQYAEFLKAYRAEKDPKEKSKLVRTKLPKMPEYIGPVMKLVEKDPSSEESFKGLTWIYPQVRAPKKRAELTAMLLEHHSDKEEMGQIAMGMSRSMPSAETEANIKKIFESNQNDSAKGLAAYSLVMYLMEVESTQSDEAKRKRFERMAKEEGVEYLDSRTSEELGKEIDKYIALVQGEYADVEYRGDVTIGQKIEGMVFERENLQIGMPVPEIEGEDVDGVEFKLSDYKGKVVMIDFWGDW